MITERVYSRREDVVTREIAGELVIVPLRADVGDLESVYTLNEIGTVVWRQLDQPRRFSEIVDAVCAEYDVSSGEAGEDVREFLESLEEAGLVKTDGAMR